MINTTFFKLIRKRGFYDVLAILYDDTDGITLAKLKVKLRNVGSNYNNFLRTRNELLEMKFILFFLDPNHTKSIKLTEHGIQTWEELLRLNYKVEEGLK